MSLGGQCGIAAEATWRNCGNRNNLSPVGVGLTGAAPTGEIIADLVDGKSPFMDVGAFSADRF